MTIQSKPATRSTGFRLFVLVATVIVAVILFGLAGQLVPRLSPATLKSAPCTGASSSKNPAQAAPQRLGLERLFKEGALPKCARSGTRAESWLMVFVGHSGSSAMISQLVQHPDVLGTKVPEAVDHFELEHNTTAALEFTRKLFEDGRKQGKSVGYKIRPTHILRKPREWAALIRKYNTRIMWNFRQNVFKAAAGEYKMKHFNDTTVIEGLRKKLKQSEICKHTKCSFPVYDMDDFHFELRRSATNDRLITTAVAYLDSGAGCVLPLPYEQYLVNPQQVMKNMFRFLGLRQVKTQPKRFKSTSDNLCTLIANWDRICLNFFHCVAWRPLMVDMRNNCGCTLRPGPDKYCKVYNW